MAKAKIGWFKRHKILTGLLVLMVLGLSYFPFHAYRVYADKQKFKEARAAIDTIYAEAVKTVGQPDNSKSTNACSRANQEFGEGPLGCSISTAFIYGVKDEAEANSKMKQVQSAITASKNFQSTSSLSPYIKDTLVVNTHYRDALDSYELRTLFGKVDCSIKYAYHTPEEVNLQIKNRSLQPFQIFLDCSASSVTDI